MRRVAAAVSGIVMALLMTMSGGSAVAQAVACSPAPCDAPAGALPEPIVQGGPTGLPAQPSSGVFDRGLSSGTVAPVAVAAAGLMAMVAALALSIRHRRAALDTALSAPLARLESARDR